MQVSILSMSLLGCVSFDSVFAGLEKSRCRLIFHYILGWFWTTPVLSVHIMSLCLDICNSLTSWHVAQGTVKLSCDLFTVLIPKNIEFDGTFSQ
jgi:hypothetical protein